MQLDAISIRKGKRGAWTRLGGGWRIPRTFTADVRLSDPQCEIALELQVAGGAVSLVKAIISAPRGTGLEAPDLRKVELEELALAAAEYAVEGAEGDEATPVEGVLAQTRALTKATVEIVFDELTREVRTKPSLQHRLAVRTLRGTRRRGKPLEPELLEAVAAVYRAHPKAPVQGVMKEFALDRPAAKYWVAKARDAGFLGPTLPRTKGELAG